MGRVIISGMVSVTVGLTVMLHACRPVEREVREHGEFRVTAYCPCEKCCGEYSDGVTASGHVIEEGDKFVASSKMFDFGTLLDVEGYGVVKVRDRGGAIQGKRLDVFFLTHQEALEWGVRYINVKEILR